MLVLQLVLDITGLKGVFEEDQNLALIRELQFWRQERSPQSAFKNSFESMKSYW